MIIITPSNRNGGKVTECAQRGKGECNVNRYKQQGKFIGTHTRIKTGNNKTKASYIIFSFKNARTGLALWLSEAILASHFGASSNLSCFPLTAEVFGAFSSTWDTWLKLLVSQPLTSPAFVAIRGVNQQMEDIFFWLQLSLSN